MSCLRPLAILLLSCSALLARAETLVAIDNANPPFMYQHEEQPQGLYPQMLQAIFARLGEPLLIQPMPWKRALLRGAAGEVGIAGIYRNAERIKLFDYSEPIFEERLMLYVQRDKPFTFDQAVREGRILAQEGSSDEANLRKLASGRLDAVVVIELAGQRLLQLPGMEHLTALPQPLSINPTFLVFAKQADQRELLQRFNQVLREMRQDGSLQRLVQQATATP